MLLHRYAWRIILMERNTVVSESTSSASKVILATLVLAIAVLSYFLFSQDNHQPIELSEEAQASFLGNEDPKTNGNQNSQSGETLVETNYPEAETTELELTLLGVVASNIETEASATIQSRLQVRTYFIEDQIAYTNAIIKEISNDRVVLDNNGEIEVLLLQGTDTTQTNLRPIDNSEKLTQAAADPSIGNRPKQLDHIIRLSSNDSVDQIEQYTVSPGLNPKLFKAARFKPGDVLQKVNGIDASTEEGLEQIQQLIPNAQTLVFSVLRGGRTIDLYLDIPSEGLQLKKD